MREGSLAPPKPTPSLPRSAYRHLAVSASFLGVFLLETLLLHLIAPTFNKMSGGGNRGGKGGATDLAVNDPLNAGGSASSSTGAPAVQLPSENGSAILNLNGPDGSSATTSTTKTWFSGCNIKKAHT